MLCTSMASNSFVKEEYIILFKYNTQKYQLRHAIMQILLTCNEICYVSLEFKNEPKNPCHHITVADLGMKVGESRIELEFINP